MSPAECSKRSLRAHSTLDPLCRGLAVMVPLLVTGLRASGAPAWRTDVSVVRALGLVPFGGEGAISAVLGQFALILPIGGQALRLAWVSAAATALSAYLIFELVREALLAARPAARLAPPLALSAALTTTLGLAWQSEGTVVGGATVATALVLAGLRVHGRSSGLRGWIATGILAGFTASESHVAGLSLVTAVFASSIARLRLPSRRDLLAFFVAGAASAALSLSPIALRMGQGHAVAQLGLGGFAPIAGMSFSGMRGDLAQAWIAEAGGVLLALSVAGFAFGLLRRRTRGTVSALLAFVAADALLGGRASPLSMDPTSTLRLLAVAAVVFGAALAIHGTALWLLASKLPFSESAAVLLVVFQFTLAVATADRASSGAQQNLAAEIWTDEALGQLTEESLVLVGSPALSFRLFAARLLRGQRPDVVVVPLPLLAHGNVAAALLQTEQGLAPVIREVSMNGRPSEYSLSALSDVRPLYIELDGKWDFRLLEHVRPRPLWLSFSPHALGRSDRAGALSESRRAFRRVLREAKKGGARDEATLAVLGTRAAEQAVALAALGDRDNARQVLSDLRSIDPALPVIEALELQLGQKRGRIDLREFLR